MEHSPEQINHHVKTYLKVFGALLVLTILTVAVSYLHLPMAAALILGLGIAASKAGLVTAFFMHLKDDVQNHRKWIYKPLILTAFFFVFMIAIVLFFYHDRLGV